MFNKTFLILLIAIFTTGCVNTTDGGAKVIVHKNDPPLQAPPPNEFQDTFGQTIIDCHSFPFTIYYWPDKTSQNILGPRMDLQTIITEGDCNEQNNGLLTGLGKAKILPQTSLGEMLYSGYFRDGYMEGRGRLRSVFKQFKYEGGFSQNMFHGRGLLTMGMTSYEGQFVWGKMDGIIRVITPGKIRREHYSNGVLINRE